ncbi:hypothetical protein Slin15195_G032200 [Septoria linicola]|uniref:Uncharacterized protein n=1 Tax=Septoria linicola TaxID=215465 RepID=A0A9Q9ASF5_9PEZI|nr:hypothetical protein Slin14017_G031220 [Septoria linicola]USW49901.1 hypothetical protein Slin15195_G032200 [Septoria linicola]
MLGIQRYPWTTRLSVLLVALLILLIPAVRRDHSPDTELHSSQPTPSNNSTKALHPRYVLCDWEYIAAQTCQPIQPGDDHCTQAAKKGDQLLQMVTSGHAPQSQFRDPADLDRYGYTTQVQLDQGEELSGTLINALEKLRIPVDAEGWTFWSHKHLKGTAQYPATKAYFLNFANLDHGVIIADNNKGPAAMNAQAKEPVSQLVPLKQWSDVLYLAWLKVGGLSKLRKLQHVFRDNISNQATIEVMRSMVGKDHLDASDMWPGHEFRLPDVRLKAAIGTPNGNGVAWLLAQHQADVGLKTIDRVNIFNCGTEDYGTWCMYLHLADSGDPNQGSNELAPRLLSCDWARVDTQTSQPIFPGDDHCMKAAKKGEQLLSMMADCDTEASQWTRYEDLAGYGYNSRGEPLAEIATTLKPAFQQLQISSQSSHWTQFRQFHDYQARPPNQRYLATGAKFLNTINYDSGVIIAEDNYGPVFMNTLQPRPKAKDRIVPLRQWSDVIFLQWRETARTQTGGLSSLRRIEHVLRDAIANQETIELMRSMIGKEKLDDGDQWPGFHYRYPDAKLKAAVGSPNGNGIAWLVAQHKAEIGMKLIDQVNIFNCGSAKPKWCLYFHLSDAPDSSGV